jgi:hypothetical protein
MSNNDKQRRLDEMAAKIEYFNPYQVLGLKNYASEADVREAYIMLSQIHHPDHKGCHKNMMAINLANKALSEELELVKVLLLNKYHFPSFSFIEHCENDNNNQVVDTEINPTGLTENSNE